MAEFKLGRLKFVWKGDWATTTAYVKDDIVQYDGQSWVCVSGHTSSSFYTDQTADKWERSASGLSWKGTWNSSTVYRRNNVVERAGSTYICVKNSSQNVEPDNQPGEINWELISQGNPDSVFVAKGDMVYRDDTSATPLTIGTNNQTLQVSASGIPEWVSNVDVPGTLSVAGTKTSITGVIYQGAGSEAQATTDGLTNPTAVLVNDVDAFSQVAHKNISDGTSASTDFIAYADNGDNDSGWIDMGITSSTFDDPAFGVTGINDGYIFMSAPDLVAPLGNGNLYISTSGNGIQNDIVFSTGGFEDNTFERMRIVGAAHGSYNAGINLVDDISTTNGKFYIGPNAKALTVDGVTASTQLNGGINSTATTITVDSTTGFNTAGYITIGSEIIFYGSKTATTFADCSRGYQGTTAATHADNAVVEQVTYTGLTNATAIYTGNADDFVQFAIKNTNSGSGASTDLIAYASDGDNDSGWIDLGITSATYSDPAFTVTGPGTGYLFFSAPATTSGTGDLLIGTDHTGSNNDIVFFTNGFDAGNERLRIIGVGANAGVEIYADTNSTSTTTGALRIDGGVGLQGNMYIGGNINIQGTITVSGGGSSVETTTLTVSDPMIVMGNGNAADAIDLGFYGKYTSSGTKHTGLVRDATDGVFKLFTGLATAPTTTVDFTGATYADLKLNNLDFTTAGKIKINGSAGTDGKFLKTTSSGMEWADAAVTVTDDTATASGLNLLFTSSTSGTITSASVTSTKLSFVPSTGTLQVKGKLAFQGSTSGAVTFQAPATAGSATYTLPSADGSSGQALVTNGSGTLSWAAAGATITNDTSTNSTFYPLFSSATSGSSTAVNTSSTKFTFNPSSGLLTVTSLTESSSIALKENISPISNGLDAILKLVGVTYDRRDGTKQNEAGLIAESVNQVLPNLVSKDEQGNPDGIHYSKLTAYLIEAVKTLTARVEELEAKK